MPIAFEIICVSKIVLCSATAAHFLNDRYGSRSENLPLALAYAFMGWISTYFWSVLWMDGVLLLPLVAEGIFRIREGRGRWLYILSFSAAILTDYYTGYMIGIFSILFWIYGLAAFSQGRKEAWDISLQFLKDTITAVCLSLFWLLPSLLSLQGGDKTGLSAWHLLPLEPIASLSDLIYKLFIGSVSMSEIAAGLPVLYCGMYVLLLTLLYFMNRKIAARERLASAGMVLLFILSYSVHSLNLIWHGFNEPVSFPYRYAFIGVFFLIYLASESSFRRIDRKLPIILGMIIICLAGYRSVSVGFAFADYRMVYAELGLAILIAGCMLVPNHRLQLILTGALAVTDLFLNSNLMLGWLLKNYQGYNLDQFRQHYQETAVLVDEIQSEDTGFYRIEKNYQYTNNDAMEFNYRGLTHFSSTEKPATKNYLGRMGYRNNLNWAAYRKGSTEFSDSVLGIKYLISDHPLPAPMSRIVMHAQLEAYENPNALPIGFLSSPDILEKDLESGNSFDLQNRMYEGITGSADPIFTSAAKPEVTVQNGKIVQEGGMLQAERAENDKPMQIVFRVEMPEDGNLYAYFNAPDYQDARVAVNDQYYSDYFNPYDWNIIRAGTYAEGDQIQITVETSGDHLVISDAQFYAEDSDKLAMLHEQISHEKCEDRLITSSWLQFNVQVESADRNILMTSIPFDESWRVTVDGHSVRPVKVLDSLLAVKLEAGTHQITLHYIPRGLIPGACVSVLTVCWLAFRQIRKRRAEKAGRITAPDRS